MNGLAVELVYQLPSLRVSLARSSDPELLQMVATSLLKEIDALVEESQDVDAGLAAIYEEELGKLRRTLEMLTPHQGNQAETTNRAPQPNAVAA